MILLFMNNVFIIASISPSLGPCLSAITSQSTCTTEHGPAPQTAGMDVKLISEYIASHYNVMLLT